MLFNGSVSLLESPTLTWPETLQISSKRFRLFVAADASDIDVETASDFATAALKRGMVYFCSWGPGCERLHDIVDEVIVMDELGERSFVGSRIGDVIITTWHDDETLEEALEFFVRLANPTDGFRDGSNSWVIVCVSNPGWAQIIRSQIELESSA